MKLLEGLPTSENDAARASDTVSECSLKISMLPIRMNVDQDTLEFLVDFSGDVSSLLDAVKPRSKRKPKKADLPITTVNQFEASSEPSNDGFNEAELETPTETSNDLDENLLINLWESQSAAAELDFGAPESTNDNNDKLSIASEATKMSAADQISQLKQSDAMPLYFRYFSKFTFSFMS